MRLPVLTLSLLLAMLAMLATGGCSQPELPMDVFYRLEVPEPARAPTPGTLPGTLEVQRPRAEGVVAERAVVYAESPLPNRFYQYTYHHWAQPPARALQDELVDYLRAAGVAEAVTIPEQRARPDWLLSTRLRGLEQVRGDGGHVHLRVEFTLRRAQDGRLLHSEEVQERLPTADNSLEAAVAAFEEALERAFAHLVEVLRSTARSADVVPAA